MGGRGWSSGRGCRAAPSRLGLGGENGKFTPCGVWLVLSLRERGKGTDGERAREKSMLGTKRTVACVYVSV